MADENHFVVRKLGRMVAQIFIRETGYSATLDKDHDGLPVNQRMRLCFKEKSSIHPN